MRINDPNLEPQIVDFGKYLNRKSVDQLVIEDYLYFSWVIDKVKNTGRVMDRFKFVDYVVNNFVSKEKCVYDKCNNTAKFLSIITANRRRENFYGFSYCSKDHFSIDPKNNANNANCEELNFQTAKCPYNPGNTRALVERIAVYSMGLKKGPKSKEYLRDFFNNVELQKPYDFGDKSPPKKSDNNPNQQELFF